MHWCGWRNVFRAHLPKPPQNPILESKSRQRDGILAQLQLSTTVGSKAKNTRKPVSCSSESLDHLGVRCSGWSSPIFTLAKSVTSWQTEQPCKRPAVGRALLTVLKTTVWIINCYIKISNEWQIWWLVLRQGLTVYARLTWNLLHRPSWPQTHRQRCASSHMAQMVKL